jgi:hypothetical protein
MSQQLTSTSQASQPIDITPIVEHGESPTAIILAIAILLSFLFTGLSGLVRIILISKPYR